MDIEREILVKVGKILLATLLVIVLSLTIAIFGAKQWFYRQVDQEVSYQIDRLERMSFSELATRTNVRQVSGWLWTARIDVYVFHATDNTKLVSVNVNVGNIKDIDHSFKSQVTADGINTVWSRWTTDNAVEK